MSFPPPRSPQAAAVGGTAADLATTGAVVNVSGAAPPSAGQVLTATDATHATWQTPSGGPGGGPTDAQVELDFSTGKEGASVSLVDATVLSTTRVSATLSVVASTDKTADEVLADPILVMAAPVAGVGIVIYGKPLAGGVCSGKYLVDVLYQ